MNTYGWVLLGQTLLALVALGLCGGWALWPFRRDERPYLWLAAPLAGLFTLGGSLALLYLAAGWPFGRCLGVALPTNVAATVACLVRRRPALPSRAQLAVGAAVALAATAWAVVVCNRSAIEAGEPTLAYVHNNDMFNYALIADWMRAHRVNDPPDPGEQMDFLPRWHLHVEGSRPTAYTLLATAAGARGTSALFSFDWLCGVVLAAAVAGFGGLFTSNPLLLVLLAAGGATSSWPTESRTAFLGKLIAYPGALLLAALALEVAARGGWRRAAVVVAVGAALGFSLNPIVPPLVLGLVLGGFAGATVAGYALQRWRGAQPPRPWPRVVRPVLAAALLWCAATLPALGVYQRTYCECVPPPAPPAKWSVVIPVALDLELPVLPVLAAGTRNKTLWGAVALVAVALALAARRGDRRALALLGVVLLVPAARLAGDYRLHAFQGLLYPLTLAGAALLAYPAASPRWVAAVAGLLALAVALRVPQHRAAGGWYLYDDSFVVVLRQSEAEAIRELAAGEAIDVAIPDYPDNHFAVTELLARGARVQFQGLAWQRTLGLYFPRLAPHDRTAPKARFSLVESGRAAPPETVRWVGPRLKLVEDRDSLAVLGAASPAEAFRFRDTAALVLGTPGGRLVVHNGTGAPAAARLVCSLVPQPGNGPRTTLRYRLGDQSGERTVEVEGEVAIPLRLAPGLSHLELALAEPSPACQPRAVVYDWRIEPAAEEARAGR